MAGPMSGVAISASQIAQQKVQDQAGQQVAKNGPSKFDAAMANKAQATQQTQGVGQVQQAGKVQAAQRVDVARAIEQIQKTQKAQVNKVSPQALTDKAAQPVAQGEGASKAQQSLVKMLSGLEKGQGAMDKLIAQGASGKSFSNGELLSLQAGVYKYTQELDLTSKIVEQATSGLKDTLKTQV